MARNTSLTLRVNIDTKEVDEALRKMKTSNLSKSTIKIAVRKVLTSAKKEVTTKIRPALQPDPKKAYQGVKYQIYKNTIGGNLSILPGKKATKILAINFSKVGIRGATRSGKGLYKARRRTRMLASYYGKDRAFVLNFLNSGTVTRVTNGKHGGNFPRGENRGAITARNFFIPAADPAMEKAARALGDKIVEIAASKI